MKKNFNQSMYDFIKINSIFNILYCTIMILKLVNTCLFFKTGLICSSILDTVASQYFKIVVVHFLGNSFKLSTNISYLLFAINRLILITVQQQQQHHQRNQNRPKNKMKILKFSIYFSLILIVCSLLSLFKLYQYELNDEKDFEKDFPFESRDESFCNNNNNQFHCGLFNFFKIFNSILNDIVLVFFNVIIDIVLIRKFHGFMERKSMNIIDADHHKNIQKSKKRMNRMIFVNSLLYVLSHMPEFITSILLIVYSKEISKFCSNNVSCDLLNEEAAFFSLISIVCQFYVFKAFDLNFKESYRDIKARFIKTNSFKQNHPISESNMSRNAPELKNLKNLIGNGLID